MYHDFVDLGSQLIKSYTVCMHSNVIIVPVQDDLEKSKSDRDPMDQTASKGDPSALLNSDLERLMPSSTSQLPKRFESVNKDTQGEGTCKDSSGILQRPR